MKNEKKLYNYYTKALKELNKEIKGYTEDYEKLSRSEQYDLARKRGTAIKIKDTLDDLNKQTTLAIKLNTKEMAVEGYMKTLYEIEKDIKLRLDFNPLNDKYIESLINKPVKGKVFSKRLDYNRKALGKKVTDELLQGAVQGRGYAEIAKRVREETNGNYKRALRIARTEGGRVQTETTQRGYEEAEDLGVIMQKQWISSLDDSTRDSHADLDGQTVDIGDEFESENGGTAMGPRMFGEASEDINCRCSTITIVNGISPKLRSDNKTKEVIENQTYKEWKKERG